MEPRPLSLERADAAFSILVRYAGAHPSLREDFIYHETKGCHEFRFSGALGFGGKFWNRNGKLSVNCYPEDETPERTRLIERTNDALAKLAEGA